MIIILSICISISFSTKSLLYNISNNKLFYTLEKISLPIYLNQWIIIFIIEFYIGYKNIIVGYYYELFIIVLILIIIGVVEEMLIKFYNKKKLNIKKILLIYIIKYTCAMDHKLIPIYFVGDNAAVFFQNAVLYSIIRPFAYCFLQLNTSLFEITF